MRRLRDVVSQPCRPGGRGLPSAATTSGCHRLAGRGWEAGGEIRRRSTETRREIFGNLCPARKHGPRSLKIAADGAPEGVSAAAVRSAKRIRRGTLPKARASRRSVSPHSSGRENQKRNPHRSAGMHGRGCLTFKSGRRCGDHRYADHAIDSRPASSSPSSLRKQGPIRRVAHDCGQRSRS